MNKDDLCNIDQFILTHTITPIVIFTFVEVSPVFLFIFLFYFDVKMYLIMITVTPWFMYFDTVHIISPGLF